MIFKNIGQRKADGYEISGRTVDDIFPDLQSERQGFLTHTNY
jgi:hypothetical protein